MELATASRSIGHTIKSMSFAFVSGVVTISNTIGLTHVIAGMILSSGIVALKKTSRNDDVDNSNWSFSTKEMFQVTGFALNIFEKASDFLLKDVNPRFSLACKIAGGSLFVGNAIYFLFEKQIIKFFSSEQPANKDCEKVFIFGGQWYKPAANALAILGITSVAQLAICKLFSRAKV